MVDTADLKSAGLTSRKGSSPFLPIDKLLHEWARSHKPTSASLLDEALQREHFYPDRLYGLVLVATRRLGRSLFPINEWPLIVNVARPLVDNPELDNRFQDDQLELIAWAELYRTEEAARLKAM